VAPRHVSCDDCASRSRATAADSTPGWHEKRTGESESMTDRERHQNDQAGPFEQFLRESAVYRAFLEEPSSDSCDMANVPVADSPAVKAHESKWCIDLEIGRARFAMALDLADPSQPSATITFPSQIYRLELDDLHHCVRRIIDAAYPQRGLTPLVALIENGSETRLDLAKYWDGALYERAITNPSLSAAIFYVQIQHSLPGAQLFKSAPAHPDLVYGFMPACGDSREFISISYLHARHISVDLGSAFLPRHRDYREGDLPADAQRLAQQIRSACKAHTPRTLL